MADKTKGSGGDKKVIIKESGRSLPTTSTSTPMPEVKPPKKTTSSGGGDKKK